MRMAFNAIIRGLDGFSTTIKCPTTHTRGINSVYSDPVIENLRYSSRIQNLLIFDEFVVLYEPMQHGGFKVSDMHQALKIAQHLPPTYRTHQIYVQLKNLGSQASLYVCLNYLFPPFPLHFSIQIQKLPYTILKFIDEES